MNWDLLVELDTYRDIGTVGAKTTINPTELTFLPSQPSCLFTSESGVPFRGQEAAKQLISVYVDTLGPQDRFKTLLTGPAGTGKTTLAWIIAQRIQNRRVSKGLPTGRFFEILPAQIESKKDLDKFMPQLQPYDTVFIDEIHILKNTVGAEPLYHTLDDTGTPRYPMGKNLSWVDIPGTVSWLAATTEPGELDGTTGGALRRRLSPEIRLEAPDLAILADIVMDQVPTINRHEALELAKRSGGLPWQVLLLLNTAKKVALKNHSQYINSVVVNDTFKLLGVDEWGLFAEDRAVISVLKQSPHKMATTGEIKYKMSEQALCSAAGIDPHTYKHIVQPKLMRQGLLTTVGGQCLTPKAVTIFI